MKVVEEEGRIYEALLQNMQSINDVYTTQIILLAKILKSLNFIRLSDRIIF